MPTYKSDGQLREEVYKHHIRDIVIEKEKRKELPKGFHQKISEQDVRDIMHLAKAKMKHGRKIEEIIEIAVNQFFNKHFR